MIVMAESDEMEELRGAEETEEPRGHRVTEVLE
jgi:hypothetical protein